MSDEPSRRSLLWETIQQVEDYPIFRLCYLSNPVKPFTEADFNDIESKSIEANNARDVTGILIANGERILQILEGCEDAVRELYSKIEKDSRHTVIKVISEVEDEVRLLFKWSMVVRGSTGTPQGLLEQFSEVYDELLHAEQQSEIAIDHVDLFREIALFETLSEKS
ncbi:BLUF domain-containing protein [Akkermansiaceae bacterium]|nr:BLUF domain-containing protein [Akkermansiaceae bacterium]MDB4585844.1 BLUF domain-containing protein [Akkermansiaceae bacterium]